MPFPLGYLSWTLREYPMRVTPAVSRDETKREAGGVIESVESEG